jgi:hypothetical protein
MTTEALPETAKESFPETGTETGPERVTETSGITPPQPGERSIAGSSPGTFPEHELLPPLPPTDPAFVTEPLSPGQIPSSTPGADGDQTAPREDDPYGLGR